MKGFQLGLEPKFTYDDFATNGASYFEKPPAAGSSAPSRWRRS